MTVVRNSRSQYLARVATEPRTLCAAFQQTAAAHPDVVALRTPDDSVSLTWGEYAARVRAQAIDDDGYVRIVDRKKELIINAAGKNMSPQNIEGAIKVACPLVMSVVAFGDDRPYVTALVTLDPDACTAYAAKAGLSDGSPAVLAQDASVRALIQSGVDRANEKLSRVEQVKKFAVLPTPWEPGGDELTPTMKLKRRPIAEKYAAEIDALYR